MPDDIRLSFLEWLAGEDEGRQSAYCKWREYYDGEHDAQLTDRQRRYLQIKDGSEFNINLCPVVVDSLVERLEVTGFADKDLGETLWQWWVLNRMDGVQKDVHTAAIRDGDTYVIVEWDEESSAPAMSHETAYDGTSGAKLHYGSERGVPVFASKRWRTESDNGADAGHRRRLNLYFPDRIEKWVSDQRTFEGAWVKFTDDEESTWPIPWVDTDGQPLGVPVIHFRNQGRGYNFGRSELADAAPVQNALNKSVIDLLSAADTAGFPIMYMLGEDPSLLSVAPGAIVYSEKPANEVKFGRLESSNLEPMSRLVDQFKITMAQVTRTPVSSFQIIGGNRPAEGTLKQEEAGLIAKAEDRQVYFGNSWEDVMRLGVRLFNTFGAGGLAEDAPVSTVWADAQIRNEKEHLESLAIKREALKIPLEALWSEAGYNATEIEMMMESDEYKARTAMQQMAAQGLVLAQEGS